MPQNKDLRRLVRTRMAATGENYTQARAHPQDRVVLEPLPAAWGMTGSRAPDDEAGLLTGAREDGDRIAQLRLRAAVFESAGFGSVVQAIAAARYLGRRLCFSAPIRTAGVTGGAGLWLCVDGSAGPLIPDHRYDRALLGTTDWTGASIVWTSRNTRRPCCSAPEPWTSPGCGPKRSMRPGRPPRRRSRASPRFSTSAQPGS